MTRSLRHLLAALACLALCGALLTACGETTRRATPAPRRCSTRRSAAAPRRSTTAAWTLAFQLDPKGLLALGGPIKLTLDGPFAGPERRPAAALRRRLRRDARRPASSDGTVLSTGRAAFVRLDGTRLQDRPRVRHRPARGPRRRRRRQAAGPQGARDRPAALDQRRAGARRGAHRRRRHDPHQRQRRGRQAAGGHRPAAHEGGRLRRRRRPAQPEDCASRSPTPSSPPRSTSGPAPTTRSCASSPSRIDFAFKDGETPIPGLDAGMINLRLRLTDVNKTKVSVAAPADARPLARAHRRQHRRLPRRHRQRR